MARLRPTTVVATVVAVLVLAGGGALLLSGFGDAGAEPRAELSPCLTLAGARRDACFDEVFARQAARGNVAPTVAALERLVRDGRLDDCHLLAHSLAHAAVAAMGVDRAFLLADDGCRMGYVHGAAERADPRAEARAAPPGAVAGERCSRFVKRDLAASCSHGYGHALLRASPGDLQASADGCRAAERYGIHVIPCEAGVMMQHSLDRSRLGETGLLAGAREGCARLAAARLRTRCHRNVGVVAAFALSHDAARAEALCRRLPARKGRSDCLAGARKEVEEARAG
ncbi:MAG: hypothetical protein ICV64_03485 [Thermoleophilia bacterium]|nr:hypothetical protein [Thermoleophilia bacterium]